MLIISTRIQHHKTYIDPTNPSSVGVIMSSKNIIEWCSDDVTIIIIIIGFLH
jgi:hypothetical protein